MPPFGFPPLPQDHSPKPNSNPSPQVNVANASSTSSNRWYPDSGASHHVTNVSQNIQQVAPFEGPDQITIGNGQGLPIDSSGYSKFASPLNPNVSLRLTNLLYVPSITKNLLSESVL